MTTTGAGTGTGSDTGTSVSTASVSSQAGAFLVGVIHYSGTGSTVTHGAGFTLSPVSCPTSQSVPVCDTAAQYADPVSSPTAFPATLSDSSNWAEAGIALNPLSPIPEYPLGLPILAILMVLGYALVRRRTRNDHT